MVSDLAERSRRLLGVATLPLQDEICVGLCLSHALQVADLRLHHHGLFDSAAHESLEVLCHVLFLGDQIQVSFRLKLAGR